MGVLIVGSRRLHPWDDLGNGAGCSASSSRSSPRSATCASRCSSATSGVKDFGTLLPGPRRRARPLRRDPVLPARAVYYLVARRSDHLMPRLRPTGASPIARVDRLDRHPDARRRPRHRDRLRGRRARRRPQRATLLERAGRRVRRRPPIRRARCCADDPGRAGRAGRARPTADVVLNAVVGFAGLPAHARRARARQAPRRWPTRRASSPAGPVVRRGARRRAAARSCPSTASTPRVYQCLRGRPTPTRSRRIVLTASGGPFRGRTRGRARPRSRSTTRWRTRPGRWARRSPSTRRR